MPPLVITSFYLLNSQKNKKNLKSRVVRAVNLRLNLGLLFMEGVGVPSTITGWVQKIVNEADQVGVLIVSKPLVEL